MIGNLSAFEKRGQLWGRIAEASANGSATAPPAVLLTKKANEPLARGYSLTPQRGSQSEAACLLSEQNLRRELDDSWV